MEILLVALVSVLTVLVLIAIVLMLKNHPKEYSEELLELKHSITPLAEQIRQESALNRAEMQRNLATNRQESSNAFQMLSNSTTNNFEGFSRNLQQFSATTDEKFARLNKSTEERLNLMRETIDNKLRLLQEDNSKKLDEMRQTVDEKLQQSVEKRFNESFKLISERLEMVHKSMGEMQNLATGVGDLKRVLTNVKTRGNLGEIQLGSILEQFLSPEQYVVNAQVKENSTQRVEFAVKMPGNSVDSNSILLPIDSKFPIEDYQRLLDGYEQAASPEELKKILASFESSVRGGAKDIHDKYINPPVTTDFAVMFVPTEGLYAEILRRAGLFERLQRELKITVVGPANLVAFLNSLQMGFRTLAIQKRSSEVWALLGAVKTEFGKFGDVLDATRLKLERAVKDIDSAGVRTRAIERKLRGVEVLPELEANELLK